MKFIIFPGSLLLLSLVFLCGCASYKATPLNTLSSDIIQTFPAQGNVTITAKAFNKADCKKYLDRDVISKGYQPVQLYIQNGSEKPYLFSLNRISLSCARPEEVAEKVHTSTAGRATGYGAAAVLTCGLFAIPAIVDGVKSSQANEALDNDFSAKTARDQVIHAHSHFNKIIFVPVNEFQSPFTVTLVDQKTNQPKNHEVFVN
jgi:hypothetical protein